MTAPTAPAPRESSPDRAPEKGTYRAPVPSAEKGSTPLVLTPEARALWELYAAVRQSAEDSLLPEDGLAAVQALYAFIEGAGGPVRALTEIGTVVPSKDPSATLLWRLAGRFRSTGTGEVSRP